MIVRTIIDKNEEERVEIFCHEKTDLVEQIEDLINNYGVSINGSIKQKQL